MREEQSVYIGPRMIDPRCRSSRRCALGRSPAVRALAVNALRGTAGSLVEDTGCGERGLPRRLRLVAPPVA